MEKFCYLGYMISCYSGALESLSERIGSAWKTFKELSGLLVRKHCLSLKQWGKIYPYCVRPLLLHSCEMWERTVADEVRLYGVLYDQDDVWSETW